MSNQNQTSDQKPKPRVKVEVVSEQEFRHKKKYGTRPVYDYDVEKAKPWAVLGYVFFVIPLVIAPKNVFARFHANQGFLFQIYMICIGLLARVPVVGWWIISPLGNVLGMFFFLFGVIMALNGWKAKLPLIGDFEIIPEPKA